MSKAIVTRYMGPTDRRGSRVVADDGDGNRVTIPYDGTNGAYDAHARAARALVDKMKWSGKIRGGGYKNGYVWVFTSSGPERDPRRSRRSTVSSPRSGSKSRRRSRS